MIQSYLVGSVRKWFQTGLFFMQSQWSLARSCSDANWMPCSDVNWLPYSDANWMPYSDVNWLPYSVTKWLPCSLTEWIPCSLTEWTPCSLDKWLPCSLGKWLPCSHTPYTKCFVIFTATTATFGVKTLIYRMLGGGSKGGSRVTMVAVEGFFEAKICIFWFLLATLPRKIINFYTEI